MKLFLWKEKGDWREGWAKDHEKVRLKWTGKQWALSLDFYSVISVYKLGDVYNLASVQIRDDMLVEYEIDSRLEYRSGDYSKQWETIVFRRISIRYGCDEEAPEWFKNLKPGDWVRLKGKDMAYKIVGPREGGGYCSELGYAVVRHCDWELLPGPPDRHLEARIRALEAQVGRLEKP